MSRYFSLGWVFLFKCWYLILLLLGGCSLPCILLPSLDLSSVWWLLVAWYFGSPARCARWEILVECTSRYGELTQRNGASLEVVMPKSVHRMEEHGLPSGSSKFPGNRSTVEVQHPACGLPATGLEMRPMDWKWRRGSKVKTTYLSCCGQCAIS